MNHNWNSTVKDVSTQLELISRDKWAICGLEVEGFSFYFSFIFWMLLFLKMGFDFLVFFYPGEVLKDPVGAGASKTH